MVCAGWISCCNLNAAEPSGLRATAPETRIQFRLNSPKEFQVFQRIRSDYGYVWVQGELSEAPQVPVTIEGRLVGDGTTALWMKLASLAPTETRFTGRLGTAPGGGFRLQLRLRHGEEVLAKGTVERVAVGEVFVIAGQSNAANHGQEKLRTRTGWVASFSGTRWQLAHDPQPGASGDGGSFIPAFGDAMYQRFHVPIGIVNVASGGTSVREWLPTGVTFTNPPTVMSNVREVSPHVWESTGTLYSNLVSRMKALGPKGFRAVLWHQGESDANQSDATRTLAGEVYRQDMERLITDTSRDAEWNAPWFVAQVSYHSPSDQRSDDIRNAQAALWKSKTALEGPDTDALTGKFRDNEGQGIHFSGDGLREHGRLWAEKVAPWLDQQLAQAAAAFDAANGKSVGPSPRLALSTREKWTVDGHEAFVCLPENIAKDAPIPWLMYAPTLPGYPDGGEQWMFEQFLKAGIAIAGVDVGEGYGSPKTHATFDALYQELTTQRHFAKKPCLWGRSRGGLWVSSWAIAHPDKVAGILGIYPVFDWRSYPGVTNAAPAYGLTPMELRTKAAELDPIERIENLARAGIPMALIHGDIDKVVPLKPNSGEVVRRYTEIGAGGLVNLIVLEGHGHSFYEGFFHSDELVKFGIARARSGAAP